MLPGWAVAAGNLRALWIAELSEDFGLQGIAGLCAAQHPDQLRIDQDFLPRAGPVARTRTSGSGCVGHEETGSDRESSRGLEPERRTQDHRSRVLAAGAGAPHGID